MARNDKQLMLRAPTFIWKWQSSRPVSPVMRRELGMKTTPWISFLSLAMRFTFLTPACDLIAEELNAPTSIRQAAGKAEAGKAPKTIQWSVLAPENGKPFHDPFAKLTQDQLEELELRGPCPTIDRRE